MSAYVVTPTGELVIYPTANYAVRGERCTELYVSTAKTQWIADVPKGWAVGWHRPTFSAPRSDDYAAVKRVLRDFDARTGRFRSQA